MFEITFTQLHGWLTAFLWPFFRITALMLASPLWGHSAVPKQVKIALAGAITVLIAPVLPAMPEIPIMSWAGVGLIMEQLVIGIAMGILLHVMLAVVMASGEYIGLQMGLGFATFFDPGTSANMVVVSRFLYMITLLLFVALNGHLIVLEILISSFTTLPIGIQRFNPEAFIMLARYASIIFATGLLLALPLVCSLLIINLALGILNRAAPQLTVFNIGFPASLTAGLALLMVLMTDLGSMLQQHFQHALAALQYLVESMAPLG
ncbi:flagellar biosynthetic protein FliR [Halomonas huangheensis]|uniref:Flagellar biosynthetic protein FliR n=1 Tax=Halomonas huangheensis TaxID=1178482 RepID=W1N788_9GAMM|nr:flagellar biosynthetic protein FliR [Halomonas huangheensis]ALM54244.1 flagellar biosynthetic protein FliR [Halomonas huangheensis]ERL50790.1 hypothetical protein BJB45_19535 [Halomonas huangheensis]